MSKELNMTKALALNTATNFGLSYRPESLGLLR